MAQQYESGFSTIIAVTLNPADTSITLAVAPEALSGRMYITDGSQREWISYTGVSGTTLTGVTRNLDLFDDPATGGTGLQFNAGTPIVLVAMHDQLPNKKVANTFVGNQTVDGNLLVDEAMFTKGSYATSYANTAARDVALGGNGIATHPYQSILAGNIFYNYNTVTAQWESIDTGTVTPAATTTILGSVELATQAEVNAGTNTGGVGPLVVQPAALKVVTDAIGVDLTFLSSLVSNLKGIVFGDGSDGNVTIAGTVTLTRDMYYNNLEIPSGQILDPAGYRVFVKGTISGTGTIRRNGNTGNAGSGVTGGTAAAVLNQGSLNAEVIGGAGGNGGNNSAGNPGNSGTAANPSLTNITGAAGGNGGSPSPGSAGAGGVSTRGVAYNQTFFPQYVHPATSQTTFGGLNYKSIAGSGGGGGGGASTLNNGGGGGGAGGNGGLIRISAYIWNFTGVISQTGGTGGAGANGLAGNTGGGGGGGGGNGGILFRIYHTLTSEATIIQTGGAGGSGGAASGTASAGVAGTTGATGETISIVI